MRLGSQQLVSTACEHGKSVVWWTPRTFPVSTSFATTQIAALGAAAASAGGVVISMLINFSTFQGLSSIH